MLHRYSDLQDRFRLRDGYSIELKTATVLQGLGFKTADFERPTETFSGGWQMRIALAQAAARPAESAAARRADQPSRSRSAQLARGVPERLSARGHPRLARSLLPRRGRHAHRRPDAADAHRLRRQLQRLPRRARRADRGDAQGEARAGRRGRARQDVHRSVPLPGDQGVAGAEPDQDAREGRADRSAARAQEDPLRLPGVREERPDGARAEARAQGLRRPRRLRRSRPAHRARRSHRARRARTASASRR